jgi:cell division protein FtsB
MRVAVILIVIAVFCGAAYYVLTHPNHAQLERLSRELAGLEEQNRQLARKNVELEKTIVALREDPRLAERRARESVGLARPDELVFQFESPEQPLEVRVRLRVRQEVIELAGRRTALETLEGALERLPQEITGARLHVVIDDDVDLLRRQQVLDIVEASPLGKEQFRD